MNALLNTLLTRRSTKVTTLCNPAPNEQDIQALLTAASRVPDHGRLVPFRFVIIQGDKRGELGTVIADAFTAQNPNAPAAKIELERKRLSHVPLVIAVISRIRCGKHPQWEQILTSGAVCQNMLLAAEALGYGAQWLTQWFAYDDTVRGALGCDDRENIAGFIHIGTKPDEAPADRERPDLSKISTLYGEDIRCGSCYDHDALPIPRQGFKFL